MYYDRAIHRTFDCEGGSWEYLEYQRVSGRSTISWTDPDFNRCIPLDRVVYPYDRPLKRHLEASKVIERLDCEGGNQISFDEYRDLVLEHPMTNLSTRFFRNGVELVVKT